MEKHLYFSESNSILCYSLTHKLREREKLKMGSYMFSVHILECIFRIMPFLLIYPLYQSSVTLHRNTVAQGL